MEDIRVQGEQAAKAPTDVAQDLRVALQRVRVDRGHRATRPERVKGDDDRTDVEFRHAHLAKVVDLEVVPLAGGLELLLLLVLGDGGAPASDGGSSSGSAVALAIALVWAGSGHMGRVTCGGGGPGDGARGIAAAARVPVGVDAA